MLARMNDRMNDASSNAENLSRVSSGISAAVVANEKDTTPLKSDLLTYFGQSLRIESLASDAPIPESLMLQSDILVIEIDPTQPMSLDRIEQARAVDQNKLLIAAVADLDLPMMRALIRRGVNDVVSLPFKTEEVYSAVVDLGASRTPSQSSLAPMWSIAHSSGGTGASTIMSNLATCLADADDDIRCCVVDLDVQFGELATLMDAGPSGNILDCLEAGDRLDFDIISNSLAEINPNLFLLSPPREVVPADEINTDQLLALLTMLRQHFDFVLLDLPTGWSEATLSAACSCEEVLLIVEQNVRNLDRAKKTVDVLESVDFPRHSVKLIVNRAEKRMFQTIRTEDIENAIDREVVAKIPLVKSGLREAQERGILLTDEDPRSAFSKSIFGLAEYLLSSSEEEDQ